MAADIGTDIATHIPFHATQNVSINIPMDTSLNIPLDVAPHI
jgi:hypothetical protein